MPSQAKVQEIVDVLEHHNSAEVARILESASAAELARVIESVPSSRRLAVWNQLDITQLAEVLLELHGDLRRQLITQTNESLLIESLSAVQMDELADLDEDLPVSVVNAMVEAMDDQSRQRYQIVSQYPDDTAGGLMDVDATAIRADVSLKAVLRFLQRIRRREGELPEHLDSLIVVDRNNCYVGILPLSDLVSLDIQTSVSEVMRQGISAIKPLTSAKEVARIFGDEDLLSVPVVSDGGQLLGRITVDDVIDVIRDQAAREIYGRAGLDQHSDMFAPVVRSSVKRALWLGINLFTALLAAWVIGWFEASIEKVVALAILMPVVASMGGVAGSQTLTLVTRALALDQIGRGNALRLVSQELKIGVLNGLFWSCVVSGISIMWFGDAWLGLVFGMAMMTVLFAGALAGALVPLILNRLSIDPALAGGVILTTVTDIVGFGTFLGLATLLIL
ncbi:MAG: magnesium transporter [Halioglobus sp.]|jgi:magnesium transporter